MLARATKEWNETGDAGDLALRERRTGAALGTNVFGT
jgi:hypothetical protein